MSFQSYIFAAKFDFAYRKPPTINHLKSLKKCHLFAAMLFAFQLSVSNMHSALLTTLSGMSAFTDEKIFENFRRFLLLMVVVRFSVVSLSAIAVSFHPVVLP